MKILNKIALLLICFNPILCNKPWTFLTYIAADNNLSSFVNLDLNEMKQGANDNVNVLAYVNQKQGGRKVAKKVVITSNSIINHGVDYDKDSGSTKTFVDAAIWAMNTAPSNFLAIGLWNHGSAMINPIKRGVCFDDSTGNYFNDIQLKNALDEIVKYRGKKIDILFFDACLMANLECDVTWADYANYIISSEEVISGYGFNYKFVLEFLSKNPQNPKLFADAMVDCYKENYEKIQNDYTLSAIDTQKIRFVANNLNNLANILLQIIEEQEDQSAFDQIKKAKEHSIAFSQANLVDLGSFYINLLTRLQKIKLKKDDIKKTNKLRNILLTGLSFIKRATVSNVTGKAYKGATGISIYFPNKVIDSSYYKLDWANKYPNWLKFLQKFCNRMKKIR